MWLLKFFGAVVGPILAAGFGVRSTTKLDPSSTRGTTDFSSSNNMVTRSISWGRCCFGLVFNVRLVVVVDESVEQKDKEEDDEESDMTLMLLSLKFPMGGAGGGTNECSTGESCELCLEDEPELDEDIIELEVDSDESELNDFISICKLAVFS